MSQHIACHAVGKCDAIHGRVGQSEMARGASNATAFSSPQKQTAAPEGAAAWEPPFLTRKMLRDLHSTMRAKSAVAMLGGYALRQTLTAIRRCIRATMRAFDFVRARDDDSAGHWRRR